MKQYTTKELAKLAHVTSRTLRHYDQIGLLSPIGRSQSGQRHYSHDQLIKLMQINFYKELGYTLKEIAKLMQNDNENMLTIFLAHRQRLEQKVQHHTRLRNTVDQIIESLAGASNINPSNHRQFQDEVKARWGHTTAYTQSQERYKQWSKKDLESIKQEGHNITRQIADIMESPIKSQNIQSLIGQHYQHINRFYDCSLEMYHSLGHMYLADPRFAKYYNDIKPGLAECMQKAIDYYCTRKDSDS